MKKTIIILAFSLTTLGGVASADIIFLGNDLLYDSMQDLTWLDQVLRNKTNVPYDGTLNYTMDRYRASEQMVADLSHMGLNDWRLPSMQEWMLTDEQLGYPGPDPNPEREASKVFSHDYPFISSDIVDDSTYLGEPFSWPNSYQPGYGEIGPGGSWVAAIMDGRAQINLEPSTGSPAPVPEPATMLLAGLGLAGAGLSGLRRKKKEG